MTDPAERDRTLARVRTTTAVTGVGALLAGGVLAGWLGHAATAGAADPATGTVEQDGGTADDGLTGPDAIPAPGGAGTGQPGVVSGGS
jgi:hypothetical protein